MPMLAPLVPILTGIAAAGTIGETIYSLVSKPGGGGADTTKQLQAAQEKQAQADAESKRKAILASLPNAQEQGGGSLAAPSLTDLAAVIAGLPGEGNTAAGKGALSAFLGTGTAGAGPGAASPGAQQPSNMVEATYGLSGSQG